MEDLVRPFDKTLSNENGKMTTFLAKTHGFHQSQGHFSSLNVLQNTEDLGGRFISFLNITKPNRSFK